MAVELFLAFNLLAPASERLLYVVASNNAKEYHLTEFPVWCVDNGHARHLSFRIGFSIEKSFCLHVPKMLHFMLHIKP